MYTSTRGKVNYSLSQAVVKGLSDDGGLFVLEQFPKLNISESFKNKSYKEISFIVLKLFLDGFSDEEIKDVIDKAYGKENFPEGEVKITEFNDFAFLELYHGPTCAFKDMALTMLPHLMAYSKKKLGIEKKTLILVATSGDTGGAALSGFKKAENTDVMVLYPDGGVSAIQEKQMLSFSGDNAAAIAYKGNFDDCQATVKSIFETYFGDALLSSANSINIGRLIPQIIYYVYTYFQLVNSGRIKYGENVDFTVPTGNFGDILAGYIAKKIGLPVNKLICASDKNNVLYDFFKTGVYDKRREFYKTNSPAMDILISSNLERLLYYASDENAEYVSRLMKELKENGYYKVGKEVLDNLKDFIPYCQDETETEKCIFRAYEKYNYLIDPHTAVAYGAAENIKGGNYNVILSTASPYKFADTIAKALNLRACKSEFETVAEIEKFTNTKAPAAVKALENFDRKTETLNRNQIEDRIYYRNKFIVKTPATSANLCVGFDCIGMAVNIYNKYKFEKAEKDGTEGFGAFGIEDNLVLKAYKETFEFIRKDYVPVKITMIETGVPVARGLGSSSCCIVAGVLAAERISGVKLSGEEKIRIAAKIEGHPDNVAPCILGGIVASVADTENLIYSEFEISDKLSVILAIPDLISKTEEARAILPEVYKRSDVVHNLSRAFLLSDALKRGDTERLRIIFDDKIHEPYRLPLIPKALEIKKYANENGFACCLSGAGSTLLILGYGDGIIKDLTEKFGEHYKFIKALAVKTGAEIIGLI